MKPITDSELELLACLAEECGEVIHIVGKILRHGLGSFNPEVKNSMSNREMLEKELSDIDVIVYLLTKAKVIDREEIESYRYTKFRSLKEYLHCKTNIDLAGGK